MVDDVVFQVPQPLPSTVQSPDFADLEINIRLMAVRIGGARGLVIKTSKGTLSLSREQAISLMQFIEDEIE